MQSLNDTDAEGVIVLLDALDWKNCWKSEVSAVNDFHRNSSVNQAAGPDKTDRFTTKYGLSTTLFAARIFLPRRVSVSANAQPGKGRFKRGEIVTAIED